MKKLVLFIILVLLVLTSCEAQPRTLNTTNGAYSVDWIAVEESGWAGGFDFDTTILSLCEIRFDYGVMYTLIDDVVQPVPTMGFLYQDNYSFNTQLSASEEVLNIGGENWGIVETPFGFELTRRTNYNGMGIHYHTMRLTEIAQ